MERTVVRRMSVVVVTATLVGGFVTLASASAAPSENLTVTSIDGADGEAVADSECGARAGFPLFDFQAGDFELGDQSVTHCQGVATRGSGGEGVDTDD